MTDTTTTKMKPEHAAHQSGTLSPQEQSILWDMEEHFWTSGADNARATTATNAVMVFPYPPGILQGDQIWPHLRQTTGWRSVVMSERRVTRCRDIAHSHLPGLGRETRRANLQGPLCLDLPQR